MSALSDLTKVVAVLRKQIRGTKSVGSVKSIAGLVSTTRAITDQMKGMLATLSISSLPQQSAARRHASSPAELHGRNNAAFIGDDGHEEFAHVRLTSKAENNKKRKAGAISVMMEGNSISDNDEDDMSPSESEYHVSEDIMAGGGSMINVNSPAKMAVGARLILENSPPRKKHTPPRPPAIKKAKTGGVKHKASHRKPMDCIRTSNL
jgi:hypothetical protein